MNKTILSISELQKCYADQIVFHSLSFQISAGETVAITGPSGCGKTTLLNLIAGLDLPDSGKITVCGHNMNQLDEKHRTLLRRQSIGFIFQFFNLIPTLTVLENCLLPIELNRLYKEKQQHLQLIKEQLNQAGLSEKHYQSPEQLSGGEQQRVAIIRALAHKPRLILADEPTGNLDQETAKLMADFLCKQVNSMDSSLLMVTHSNTLASRADRIIHMQNKSFRPIETES